MEDPGHRKLVLILPNGPSKPGQRSHNRNLISTVGGIRTQNLLIDNPAYYHWAITALWIYEFCRIFQHIFTLYKEVTQYKVVTLVS